MRARDIKPGFFKNDQLAECSMAARLLFPGLWMMADKEGRLENRPMKIRGEVFPFDNLDVTSLLNELERAGLIRFYSVNGNNYIWIPRFNKHQSPHKSERPSELPAHPDDLGCCENAEKTDVSDTFPVKDDTTPVKDGTSPEKDGTTSVNPGINPEKDGTSSVNPGINPEIPGQIPLTPSSLTPSSLTPSSLTPSSLGEEGATPPTRAHTPAPAHAREEADAAPQAPPKPKRRHSPAIPTVDEVREYCVSRGNSVNAGRFCDYYAAQGWRLSNGQSLRDWKAAVRNWEARDRERPHSRAAPGVRIVGGFDGAMPMNAAEIQQARNDEILRQVYAERCAKMGASQ